MGPKWILCWVRKKGGPTGLIVPCGYPNRSLQRRDTWDSGSATIASRPRLPDSWTSAPKEGVKQSLSVVARCLVKGLVKAKLGDGADAMKASCLRGRAERERAARGHYRARCLTFRRGEWSEARQHGGAVQLIDGLHTQCEYSSTMSNLKEYGCQRERMAAKTVHVPPDGT